MDVMEFSNKWLVGWIGRNADMLTAADCGWSEVTGCSRKDVRDAFIRTFPGRIISAVVRADCTKAFAADQTRRVGYHP
jgi:hypothetical protein